MTNLQRCLMSRTNYTRAQLTKGLKLLLLVYLTGLGISTLAQTTSIAFASCIDDEKPNHPIWNVLIAAKPDVTIFMGDNIYLDLSPLRSSASVDQFDADYARLEKITKFQTLRESSQILAIWDDNDYGQRDGDRSFELKDISKQKFLDFWKIDPNSERANRDGNYDSVLIGEGAQTVQVILSDTRYFRSPWKRDSSAPQCVSGNIVPTNDRDATILGEAQWSWLEAALKQPVALHILVSGIQLIPEDHCFERWAGIPLERDRLLRVLSQASAPSIILSGDRHLAETSRLPANDDLDIEKELFEFTSSSLTSRFGWGANEQNRYRVTKDNIRVNNFGLLNVDWEKGNIKVEYVDEAGTVLQEFETVLSITETAL